MLRMPHSVHIVSTDMASCDTSSRMSVWTLQVIQLASLHILFAAVAFLAAAREVSLHASSQAAFSWPHASSLDAFTTLWHYNQVRSALT